MPRISRTHVQRTIILILLISTVIVGFSAWYNQEPSYDFPLKHVIDKKIEDITDSTGAALTVPQFITFSGSGSSTSSLPTKILIEVPFLVQAPTGNWEMPYQEACEEASLITVHHFLKGTTVTPEQADKEILDIVQWENEKFNYSADVTIEELKKIAEDYYSHRGELFYDPSIDDMKRLLASGHPIIVPLAGRDIGNPYYSGQGPWYHMLVVTGYDAGEFITNDVGTRRGKSYRYPQQRLHEAIHNWTGQKEDIRNGRKVILVIE